jgi:hypothetical protein
MWVRVAHRPPFSHPCHMILGMALNPSPWCLRQADYALCFIEIPGGAGYVYVSCEPPSLDRAPNLLAFRTNHTRAHQLWYCSIVQYLCTSHAAEQDICASAHIIVLPLTFSLARQKRCLLHQQTVPLPLGSGMHACSCNGTDGTSWYATHIPSPLSLHHIHLPSTLFLPHPSTPPRLWFGRRRTPRTTPHLPKYNTEVGR